MFDFISPVFFFIIFSCPFKHPYSQHITAFNLVVVVVVVSAGSFLSSEP